MNMRVEPPSAPVPDPIERRVNLVLMSYFGVLVVLMLVAMMLEEHLPAWRSLTLVCAIVINEIGFLTYCHKLARR